MPKYNIGEDTVLEEVKRYEIESNITKILILCS